MLYQCVTNQRSMIGFNPCLGMLFRSRSFLSHTSFRISFLTFHHHRASKISRDSLFRLWSSILLQPTGDTYLYDIEKKFRVVSMYSLLAVLLSDKRTKYWKYNNQSNQSFLKYDWFVNWLRYKYDFLNTYFYNLYTKYSN